MENWLFLPMLTTNLLPYQEKKFIEREKIRRVVRYFALLLSLIFLLGAILLLPAFLPVFFEKRELERSLLIEKNASAELGVDDSLKRVRHLKSVLSSIRLQAAKPLTASAFLRELRQTPESGIVISSLVIKKSGEIVLSGNARTRRDLLDLEKRLRESGLFQEISSPLSNIIRETDVSFTIQGKINPKYAF